MAKKTKAQEKRERFAAMLVGAQMLEAAVRDAARVEGVPLPPGNVLAPEFREALSGGMSSAAHMASKRGRKPVVVSAPRTCGLQGCGRERRSKGYCPAHYQKLRLLERTGRRPATWVDEPTPGTVEDVVLPRGRAASKALAEAKAGKVKKGARA